MRHKISQQLRLNKEANFPSEKQGMTFTIWVKRGLIIFQQNCADGTTTPKKQKNKITTSSS